MRTVKGYMMIGNTKIPMDLPKDCAFLLSHTTLDQLDDTLAYYNQK